MDVYLIINEELGPLPEAEFLHAWGIKRLKTPARVFRDTLSQLEPFYGEPGIKFFLMDTDIVFVGFMLERLSSHSEDIVVQREFAKRDSTNLHWINLDRIPALDPFFEYPGWAFNSGQWAGTSGVLKPDDFRDWITDEPIPRVRHPEVFYRSQGLLNYVIMKRTAEGALTMGYEDVAIWGNLTEEMNSISLEAIQTRSERPVILHWAGIKAPKLEQLPRADILDFFERYYYSRFTAGVVRKWVSIKWDRSILNLRRSIRYAKRKAGLSVCG